MSYNSDSTRKNNKIDALYAISKKYVRCPNCHKYQNRNHLCPTCGCKLRFL